MSRRDTTTTITGWTWLDTAILPFWTIYCRWQRWRLYRQIGHGDYRKGERLLREAIGFAYDPVVEAELVLLLEER